MIDEFAPVGTIADLFDPEPATWGLRGDPYVWRSLRTMLAKRVLPTSERDLVEILRSSFRWTTGNDLQDQTTDRIYREELARGGMSSGQVDLEIWRNVLLPLLVERWRILAPTPVQLVQQPIQAVQ
ncbi:hypothetical protein Caci_6180 [Catenulispora acidiphila DSM 44928]|uniref:Uncharacterized protein n=1 Tax=Catenulispora acidiphila (strain DSM 44928 / JCM 14897 / NBRC 102108 / NRRL B-24433 / ID139908) TaxID=479433 RepID=C7QIF7_CATAD|nr:hypothetical protein [Catenulispora acidiphila]ACU75034.1 hypothetical protein Caci_6180 [Catenulispora acidiphila DSM 44928]